MSLLFNHSCPLGLMVQGGSSAMVHAPRGPSWDLLTHPTAETQLSRVDWALEIIYERCPCCDAALHDGHLRGGRLASDYTQHSPTPLCPCLQSAVTKVLLRHQTHLGSNPSFASCLLTLPLSCLSCVTWGKFLNLTQPVSSSVGWR